MDFDTLPKTHIDREAVEEGDCKYLAFLIRPKNTPIGEQKRIVWATGREFHRELYTEVHAMFSAQDYVVKPDGGGLLELNEERKMICLYGKSTDYGPDLYLRSTALALQHEFPAFRAFFGNP